MRSNLAIKQEQYQLVQSKAEIFDFNKLNSIQVAVECEAATHLQGNIHTPDYEDFLSQYGEGVVSDLA